MFLHIDIYQISYFSQELFCHGYTRILIDRILFYIILKITSHCQVGIQDGQ